MIIWILTLILVLSLLFNLLFVLRNKELHGEVNRLEFEKFISKIDHDLERRDDSSYNEPETDNKRTLQ